MSGDDQALTPPPRYLAGKRARQNKTPERPTPLDRPSSRSHMEGGLLSPPTPDLDWRDLDLDDSTFDAISPEGLVTYLLDLSPELSRALWDFLRFTNPGFEIKALDPDSEEEEIVHTEGQDLLDEFVWGTLRRLYGSTDVVINRLFTQTYTRGAVFTELVLDDNGEEMVDLATPDPHAARFKRVSDPVRGQIWQLGQYQNGQWVDLSQFETIHYVPVDPMPGDPYGRAPVQPAVFAGMFILGLLHDIRRVIAQQGYPRYDISIDSERLEAAMPADVRSDEEKKREWVGAIIDAVTDVYSNLQPDDAYIHVDWVEVNGPKGAVDSSSLRGIDPIMTMLERMIVRALKTMPLSMGINEATSETHANRQWEIQVAGIKSIQHLVENTLEDLLRVGLEAAGVQADVQVRFAELRSSEMLRDALTEQQLIANAREKYNAGFISQDEASEEVTGSPADSEEPRDNIAPGTGMDIADPSDSTDPEEIPGETENSRRVRAVDPVGANLPLPEIPDRVTFSLEDVEAVADLWDDLMPDRYRGLIYAQTEEDAEPLLSLDRDSPWIWESDRRRYVHEETGDVVTWSLAVELRDRFLRLVLEDSARSRFVTVRTPLYPDGIRAIDPDDLAAQLSNGDISVQEWLIGMRQNVKEAYIAEYALGVGGIENMTFADYGRVGNMLAPHGQYKHLQRFAEQIQDGDLSEAQIAARSRNYVSSSVQAFERGRAVAVGVYEFLPEFPGDGNQDCKGNCRCSWKIDTTADEWRCTWVLDPSADHCETCIRNGSAWNPLVISRESARSLRSLYGTHGDSEVTSIPTRHPPRRANGSLPDATPSPE